MTASGEINEPARGGKTICRDIECGQHKGRQHASINDVEEAIRYLGRIIVVQCASINIDERGDGEKSRNTVAKNLAVSTRMKQTV